MVHCLHPLVRELQQLTVSDAGEHVRIEMPGGIQRIPSRTHHVPWMQDHRARIASPGSVEQQLFYRGFLDPVIAERMSRRVFGCRHSRRPSVHPDRAAMEQEGLLRL